MLSTLYENSTAQAVEKRRRCGSIINGKVENKKHATREEIIVCREKLKGITGIRASSEQWR